MTGNLKYRKVTADKRFLKRKSLFSEEDLDRLKKFFDQILKNRKK